MEKNFLYTHEGVCVLVTLQSVNLLKMNSFMGSFEGFGQDLMQFSIVH